MNLETKVTELGDRSKATKIFEQLYQQCHLGSTFIYHNMQKKERKEKRKRVCDKMSKKKEIGDKNNLETYGPCQTKNIFDH